MKWFVIVLYGKGGVMKNETKGNLVIAVIALLMFILILMFSQCTVINCKEYAEINDPEFHYSWMVGMYEECEVKKIKNFTYLLITPKKELIYVECMSNVDMFPTCEIVLETKWESNDETQEQ